MLKEKLQKDLNEALKAGDQVKRLVLGTLMSAIKNREVEKRTKLSKTTEAQNGEEEQKKLQKESQLTDEEIIQVIASEIKKRKESVELYQKGGREELAQKEQKEIEALQDYMPEQLGEDKIREEVEAAIESIHSTSSGQAVGPKDMGKVIGAVMGKFKGQVDGGVVSKITKELLQP